MGFLDELLNLLLFMVGASIAGLAIFSAIRTFVLPRSATDPLMRAVFLLWRLVFRLRVRFTKTYEQRDLVLALFAPVSLISMLAVWYIVVMFGYMLMFRALGTESWYQAMRYSGSSLLTLGFEPVDTLAYSILAFSEATLGLMLVALLVAYLPAIYAAFARRESAVTLLEVRAGAPPSAVEMIKRYHRIHGLNRLTAVWENWEIWFAELDESHTSLAALVFFRSPSPRRSWVTAAGTVLDAASLTLSALDLPSSPQAALCIRSGYIALREIADYFEVEYDPQPASDGPISISRAEFDDALAEMEKEGLPLVNDREAAWRNFRGWRVNYDRVLIELCRITIAPPAVWSSDRAVIEA